MTIRVGLHLLRHRLLRRAETHGRTVHRSLLRFAAGFEAVRAASVGSDVKFITWHEREPADEFVGQVDVLLGVPDIRLLKAREQSGHRPPYLALIMGDATRAVPFATTIMSRLQPDDTLVCSCTADREILGLFLDPPTDDSVAVAPMPSDLLLHLRRQPLPAAAMPALAGLDPQRPLILCAERMTPAKGVHRTIPFTAYLRDRGHHPVLVFLKAGATSSRSAYQLLLERRVQQYGLTDSTFFLPILECQALAAMYERSTFVVSPSTIYDNNYGYIPVESMAAGTPPIVSDWGGYRDIVLDGVTGARMPTTLEPDRTVTVDWLPAARTAAALLADPDRYHRVTHAGQRRVYDGFSVPASLRIYSELALAALRRKALTPWRINQLGMSAIEAGWTDQTDNADRTGRVSRTGRPRSAQFYRIHNLVYEKYATRSKIGSHG